MSPRSDEILQLAQVTRHAEFARARAEAMHAQLPTRADAVRGALIAAEWLQESQLPWSQLVPVIIAGLPQLLDQVGRVRVMPRERDGMVPVWGPPTIREEFTWTRSRQTLEIAARLCPRIVRGAMDPGRHLGTGGALLGWMWGSDQWGSAALGELYWELAGDR